MLKCFATLLLVIAAVSGCYFPSDFTADLQIDRQGRYRFTYIGKLTDVSLARQLALGRLQGLGLQKRVEIAERDMRRDSAFKKIQYEEKARFDISYQREGYIVGERSFDFVRLNSRFLTLKYNKNTGEITMIGGKPNENHAKQLEEAGLEFNGVLRVWTNAQPTKHNSKNVRPQGQLIVYTWDIENVRQKVPLFKFVTEIQ
ncbi:MAG: hypothetical protein VX085_11735 [Pseudomonadota bacterium]|nr:hypothetical protein [Pseudomonadota bacterium]